jgi:L-aspartate oxidase
LEEIGVKFSSEPALEAGHSVARIWHTSDFTGRDILNQLIKLVTSEGKVVVQEDCHASELIMHDGRCYGVYARNGESAELSPIYARNTILATGGLGQLFAKTTNTLGSGGDGVAMAIAAGIEPIELEFVQFHPTALDKPDNGRYFLLSETLRGFGAKIVNHKGEPFMHQFDKRGDLAPRDLVARAVYFEQMNGPAYLDMRHLDGKEVNNRYPNIIKRLKEYGFDFAKDLIPITPVAHYSCGGVPADVRGATRIPGLFAVGEVARTGIHGANRLASNSLLEAVVFAQSMAGALEQKAEADRQNAFPDLSGLEIPKVGIEDIAQVKGYAQRIGKIMWDYVGIVRTREGLNKAKIEITSIPARDFRIQQRQTVCYAMIQAAIKRSESIGTHYLTEES